jgi:MoaA/NifB/PqqE/SkfB family radical SAM enzyme
MFVRNNGVRQIYVPTNGSFADRTVNAVRGVLEEPSVDLFAVEFSLDGLAAYHDTFRGMKDAFARAMATYDALAAVQQRDPRLRIHSISTVTGTNLDEIRRLTEYLYDRCPAMDHHNLALIRGDRKNPSLQGPALAEYSRLYEHVRSVWAPREKGRYGSWVEPMLQAAKIQTAQERRQVVPCSAGVMNAVIYANGDVSLCETHAPIGNLRQASFRTLWRSDSARQLRRSIAARECHCTNEIFLWPSIVYRPLRLIRMLGQTQPWSDARTATSQPTSGGGGPLPAGLNG